MEELSSDTQYFLDRTGLRAYGDKLNADDRLNLTEDRDAKARSVAHKRSSIYGTRPKK